MMFDSICRQCEHFVSWPASDEAAVPVLYNIYCLEHSPNFMTQDGCFRFEMKEQEEGE